VTIFKIKTFKYLCRFITCVSVAMKLLGSPACNYQPPCLSNLRLVGPSILQLSISKSYTTMADARSDRNNKWTATVRCFIV